MSRLLNADRATTVDWGIHPRTLLLRVFRAIALLPLLWQHSYQFLSEQGNANAFVEYLVGSAEPFAKQDADPNPPTIENQKDYCNVTLRSNRLIFHMLIPRNAKHDSTIIAYL